MSKLGMSRRVCGVTVRFTPSPASRVWGLAPCCHHGFADSPVSLFRHPLRGFGVSLHVVTTGSRTHPCLYSVTRFAGLGSRSMLSPRVRGLTRVFIPSPASRVWGLAPCCHHGFANSPVSLFRHPLRGFGVSLHVVTTGSRTHPCLYSVTRFAGLGSRSMLSPRVRGLTRVFIPSPASRVWGLAPCCHHGFANSPVSLFRHPLRGFGVSLHVVTTGSRPHPCLYSVTRFAGLGSRSMSSPRVRGLTRVFIPSPASRVWGLAPCRHHGFADSPVSLFRHPLRGFGVSLHVVTTGSRTHPCLYSVTRFAGLGSRSMSSPRVRGLTRVFIPSPASRVWGLAPCRHHGFAD